jgi:DNA-binding transcriptional ArsR family regulator
MMLRAKGLKESFSSVYDPAERALARLDALLPATDPLDTLQAWVRQLREDEVPFLEGGSETYVVHDHAYDRSAPRGAAWAAALAAAMRPQLVALGAAPLALAGLAPRGAFRAVLEQSVESWLTDALGRAAHAVREDLDRCRRAEQIGAEALAERNRSSCAHRLWPLLVGLGPLTRAEAARALGVTKATASHGVTALVEAGLVSLRSDGALLARCFTAQVGMRW